MSNHTATNTAPRTCLCGCGAEVKRRFAPGHDAILKSRIKMAARHARTAQARERAVNEALAFGWESHLDLDVLHGHQLRNRRGQVRLHLDTVERFLVAPSGLHHARRNCACLTAEARQAGALNATTKLATEAFTALVDATAEVVASLKAGWDACSDCTVDWTLGEWVESSLVNRANVLAAFDAEGLTRGGNARKGQVLAEVLNEGEWAA